MNGKLKKLKGSSGDYILPITHSDGVFVESNKTLTQKLAELGGGTSLVKQWAGKKFNHHGDSVAANTTTLGKSYADLVKTEHQFGSFISYARSGYNMGQIYTDFITQDTTADVVLLSGGGNVFSIGTIDDVGTDTVYGALNNMAQWHFTNMPNAKLVIITAHQVRYIRDVGSVIYTNNGDLRRRRSQAMLDIAKKYSLPVIHFWDDLGITAENADNLTIDGTHPNEQGYQMMAKLVNRKLYDI